MRKNSPDSNSLSFTTHHHHHYDPSSSSSSPSPSLSSLFPTTKFLDCELRILTHPDTGRGIVTTVKYALPSDSKMRKATTTGNNNIIETNTPIFRPSLNQQAAAATSSASTSTGPTKTIHEQQQRKQARDDAEFQCNLDIEKAIEEEKKKKPRKEEDNREEEVGGEINITSQHQTPQTTSTTKTTTTRQHQATTTPSDQTKWSRFLTEEEEQQQQPKDKAEEEEEEEQGNQNYYFISSRPLLTPKRHGPTAYLPYQSCHPPPVLDSIPMAQMIRLARNCTAGVHFEGETAVESAFLDHARVLALWLRQRGYPGGVIKRAVAVTVIRLRSGSQKFRSQSTMPFHKQLHMPKITQNYTYNIRIYTNV